MKTYRTVLCLLPLFLSACGGGTASKDAQATGQQDASVASRTERIKACDLLTADQVSQIFGTSFKKGRLQEHGTGPDESYFSICVFDGADPSAQAAVSLTVRPAPGLSDPAAALQAQVEDVRKHAAPDYALDPVPELGPGAGWDGTSHQITLFEPGLMLIMTAQGRGVTKEQVVQVAKTAVGNLPSSAG